MRGRSHREAIRDEGRYTGPPVVAALFATVSVNVMAASHAGAQKDDKKMEKKGDMKKDDKKMDKKEDKKEDKKK